MSEWQPAIFRKFHERPIGYVPRCEVPSAKEMEGKLIFVEETSHAHVEIFRAMGCESNKFYRVRGFSHVALCEHEILTD